MNRANCGRTTPSRRTCIGAWRAHRAIRLAGLARDGSQKRDAAGNPAGARGGYGREGARTFGGFDQMTAIVGGLWDSMLGEGRRFWIVATSDSHAHYADAIAVRLGLLAW